MRAGELVELLRALPLDAEVDTEGCDCVGEANSVALEEDGRVLICRSFRGEVPPRLQAEAEAERAAHEQRMIKYRESLPAGDPFGPSSRSPF